MAESFMAVKESNGLLNGGYPASTPPVELVTSSSRGLVAACLYGICSMTMAFANKTLMNTYSFNYPFMLMSCQMVFTALLLDSLRLLSRLDLPSYTLERGYEFLVPSLFYGIHSVLSLAALSGMNIPMYGVIKRCAPMVTLLLGVVLLGRAKPSKIVTLAVSLITIGCVIAGYGDLGFDLYAYTAGGASVVSQALYLVLLQKISQSEGGKGKTATETLHLNSYNTLPVMVIGATITGEAHQAFEFFRDAYSPVFFVIFVIVTIMGCLLNYLLFLCTTLNSALTTTIVGTTKSVIQTVIGMFTFGGISINVFTVAGIVVNLSGGLLYSFDKYRQSKAKETLP